MLKPKPRRGKGAIWRPLEMGARGRHGRKPRNVCAGAKRARERGENSSAHTGTKRLVGAFPLRGRGNPAAPGHTPIRGTYGALAQDTCWLLARVVRSGRGYRRGGAGNVQRGETCCGLRATGGGAVARARKGRGGGFSSRRSRRGHSARRLKRRRLAQGQRRGRSLQAWWLEGQGG